jgi:hypothetical protein
MTQEEEAEQVARVMLDKFSEALARAEKAEALVERAFRDGVAYATNVNVKDVCLAWEQSQVRAALAKEPSDV